MFALSIARTVPGNIAWIAGLAICALSETLVASNATVVTFDAPAIAVAEPLDAGVTSRPTTGGQLLRIKMLVSTLIDPNFRGRVDELVIQVESPSQTLRVLDLWPQRELYTQVDGTISVENHSQQNQNFNFNISGGYEPFARGAASGDYQGQKKVDERYQRRPPMQMLTSSGTVNRGYGAFFKFRPGPSPVLDGDREIALLVEAPMLWRGDLLRVSMRAVGQSASGDANQTLGVAELWTAVHRQGDQRAAEAARRCVTSEQKVRRLAEQYQPAIEQRSLPTVFHKVGAALDVVEPKIPADYLNQILFNLQPYYFNTATSRLPVDLRVAALDYWDERSALLNLAKGQALVASAQ